MVPSDLEFRYADLSGNAFKVSDDWTIMQLLEEYRPEWRIRQYNYIESSLLIPGTGQPFILRLQVTEFVKESSYLTVLAWTTCNRKEKTSFSSQLFYSGFHRDSFHFLIYFYCLVAILLNFRMSYVMSSWYLPLSIHCFLSCCISQTFQRSYCCTHGEQTRCSFCWLGMVTSNRGTHSTVVPEATTGDASSTNPSSTPSASLEPMIATITQPLLIQPLKDSAPAPDGIPYSAWRLSPEDSYPVLEHLMGKMIAGTRAAPVQVGVWIPKAKLGPTADYFRPLGMPNTCDRLVDGTIAAVIMKATCAYMHPSQVVMNCFKEPQHAVNAIQTLLDSDAPTAALLVDLQRLSRESTPTGSCISCECGVHPLGYATMPNMSYSEG